MTTVDGTSGSGSGGSGDSGSGGGGIVDHDDGGKRGEISIRYDPEWRLLVRRQRWRRWHCTPAQEGDDHG